MNTSKKPMILRVYQPTIPLDVKHPPKMVSGVYRTVDSSTPRHTPKKSPAVKKSPLNEKKEAI
ncbi:MAG: hypothetical protein K2Q14_00550 [Gammaproteobacteria bacterium]|nr:hypothetical protein [Gammaproteobacteria bacterium]